MTPYPATEAIKTSNLASLGQAAAIGALLSSVARTMPGIATLRNTNPMLYDAALAVGAVEVLEAMKEKDVNHDQSLSPLANGMHIV
jgi:hypothetical protein